MTTRHAIIGSGMMGQEHIRNIALLPEAQLTAIADPDEGMRHAAATLAGQQGFDDVAAYGDFFELIPADKADAVIVAVRTKPMWR